MESFKHLWSYIAVIGGLGVEVSYRVKEASKCLGGMKSVMRNKYLVMGMKRRMYEGVTASVALYGGRDVEC